ncbi:hypothetical protein PsYK624_143250 [Phanerochaete sordida]|uniref:Uncharacterized protein n=1 Tax=Phanerochaete sordida TaxID=48140 RepID=A0A9P3GLP6_9APHY|nr:hypothetical protein PsYK624_143250 [Phanerochaete sordida]
MRRSDLEIRVPHSCALVSGRVQLETLLGGVGSQPLVRDLLQGRQAPGFNEQGKGLFRSSFQSCWLFGQ